MEIKFKDVEYNDFHDLNFTISNSDITGIFGRGKTQLLRLIDAIDIATGKITYDDIELNKNNLNEIRRKISIVEQEFQKQLFLNTVKEHMEFIIKYYKLTIKDPNKKILDSLKIVGLSNDYLEKNITSLSNSELKLIQLAISLLSNPDIILLDEPFINLDTKNEKKILVLLNKLKDHYKKTIVIASHDSNMLYKYTSKIIIIKNNKILIEGKTKEVYEKAAYLIRNKIEIPDIVMFTYKAKHDKNIHIDYHRDIRDLIKDIYKHV